MHSGSFGFSNITKELSEVINYIHIVTTTIIIQDLGEGMVLLAFFVSIEINILSEIYLRISSNHLYNVQYIN